MNIIDLSEFTNILIKTRLTANQLYLCFLLHEKDVGNTELYRKHFGFFSTEDVKELIKKDFIFNTRSDGEFQFIDLHSTPLFNNLVSVNAEEEGEELWREFPSWLLINGRKAPAKAISQEKLIEDYLRAIKNSKKLHREIILKVRAWKDNNNGYATMNIKNFVGSKHWETLDETEGRESIDFKEV